MNQRVKSIFLTVFLLSALVLRVYKIDRIPPSLSWDEVSIGYNAFSILKTGRDEHGKFMPHDAFAAYGDYKPPLSIYLTVPFVALLGLNETSVRLPSALLGAVSVYFVYLIAQELIKDRKKKRLSETTNSDFYYWIPFMALFVATFSPWHINISRAGFEANIAYFLILGGIFSTLKARFYPKLFIFSGIPFVLSIYTFNSARITAPFVYLGLLIFSFKYVRNNIFYVISGFILSIICVFPVVGHLLSPEARLRFNEVNIFSDPEVINISNRRIAYENNVWWAKVIHNRRFGYLESYLRHYFDHFEPWYLFIRGDGNPKFSIQDVGQFYIIDSIFLVIGVYVLMDNLPGLAWLLMYILGISIAPAAVARETPHALRTLNGLITWNIVIAFGLGWFIVKHLNMLESNKTIRKTVIFLFTVMLYVFSIGYYVHNYYAHYPKEFSKDWQYGYREAIDYVKTLKKDYREIVVTDSIGRPYMYFLFYLKYDPKLYLTQKISYFDDSGFYHVNAFDKYKFISQAKTDFEHGNLYILPPNTGPANSKILTTIKALDGTPVLDIIDL